MLEVLPIQDKQEQEALCARCHIPFRTELLAYRAEDESGFCGICQFSMNGEGGHIYHLAPPVGKCCDDALFVMGRAALNFIDLCGVHIAFFDGECHSEALLRRIGFVRDEHQRHTIDLKDFFTHPCSHHPQ